MQKMYGASGGSRPNNNDPRVIRSEVWNCFDLEGLNAICRACSERLKVGPTRQTSSLWRHLKRHSREVQNQYLRPRTVEHLAKDNDKKYRNSTGVIVQRKEQQQLHQHFNIKGGNGGAGDNYYSSSADQFMLDDVASQQQNNALESDGCGPRVTVDCNPVESLDLEQLLGIRSSLPTEEQTPPELDQQMDDMEEEDDEGGETEVATLGGGAEAGTNGKAKAEFQTAMVEFLLENALSFRRLLHQSPSLGRLLRLFTSSSAQQGTLARPLPSPDSLIHGLVPKMFARALDERKTQFEADCFVLMLRRCRVESGELKGYWILRVSAVKLSESFGLCSRCLGVFAFRGGLNRMRDALQRCFETGQVQLKLWQVSAVVHDGSADFVQMCRQLDLPSIPSARALLRNVYSELDKLDFGPDCVRRVKSRFEQTIGDVLDGSHFSAFSIAVPALVTRADAFFHQQGAGSKEAIDANKGAAGHKAREEQRLVDKFRTLWQFQREQLLSEPAARWPIFLNPNECHQQNGPFDADQWAQIEASIVEELVNISDCGELNENEMFKKRAEIEAEVNNFVDTAICEGRRQTTTPSNGATEDGGAAGSNAIVVPGPAATQQSLSELLFWWRVNLERFPRVGHLARQFCAVPLCAEMGGGGGDWKSGGKNRAAAGRQDIDVRNAEYAAELLKKDLLTSAEGGDEEEEEKTLERLTQMLTLRMAVLEKNGCALPD